MSDDSHKKMATYNYGHYNNYNTAFDNQAHDRNSQMYWDAVSMTSSDRNSIALSLYHSVPENLNQTETNMSHQAAKNDKVKKNKNEFFFSDNNFSFSP